MRRSKVYDSKHSVEKDRFLCHLCNKHTSNYSYHLSQKHGDLDHGNSITLCWQLDCRKYMVLNIVLKRMDFYAICVMSIRQTTHTTSTKMCSDGIINIFMFQERAEASCCELAGPAQLAGR